MRHSLLLLSPLLLLFSTGCASILSKSQYPVTVNSFPSGADVTVKNKSGMEICTTKTPTTLSLKASRGFFQPEAYSFDFKKDGFYPTANSMSAGMDPWYIGNIVFGGLIGILLVDPATGAMWKLDDAIQVSLQQDPSYKSSPPPPQTDAVPPRNQTPAQSTATDVYDKLKRLKELKDEKILTEEEYEEKRKMLIKDL